MWPSVKIISKIEIFQYLLSGHLFMRMPFLIRAFDAPSTDPVPREGSPFLFRHLMWQKAVATLSSYAVVARYMRCSIHRRQRMIANLRATAAIAFWAIPVLPSKRQ
jgi:hypothetical protein